MKKTIFALVLFVLSTVFVFAQDLDGLVKNAVNSLASHVTSHVNVSIGGIFLQDTETASELSRTLAYMINAHAPNTGKFSVVPLTRSARRSNQQEYIIKGMFLQTGNNIRVTLNLIVEPGGRTIANSNFSISVASLRNDGIDILPANLQNQNEAVQREEIFTPPPAPRQNVTPLAQTSNTPAFQIAAWPNSDTFTFIDGDELRITLEANRDCFFKVYHIDKDKNMQMIYPNTVNRNNQLQANVQRTIPDAGIRYNIQAPFGQDTILVIASTQQFVNLEAEFAQVQQATRGTVNAARGLGMQVIPGTQAAETVETRFNFTSLAATHSDETLSFPLPPNMTEVVQSMRNEVTRLNGTFTGSNQSGNFSYTGVTGRYQVSGNTLNFYFRYTDNRVVASATRGTRPAFSFTIERPSNIPEAVRSVRTGIENSGGSFTGDEQQGSFRAKGITGQYMITDQVNVTITEKPLIIPNSMIEREVRGYFSGR